MSLQDIRDGLYYVLTTWGPYAAREVSTCAFDVLSSDDIVKRLRGTPDTPVLVTIRRADEKRAAEKKIRENEVRFRSLYENATVGIYRTTPDGRVLFANLALVKMIGFDSFDELAQRNLEDEEYKTTYPREDFKRRMEENNSVRGLQYTWRRKDGSVIHVRESAHMVRDENGKALDYEGIVEDVTEQVRTEDQLRKLSRAVEQSSRRL